MLLEKTLLTRRLIPAALVFLLSAPAAFAVSEADTKAGISNFTRKQDYTAGRFSDVSASQWFAPAVQSVYELGLMNGKTTTAFYPEDQVKLSEAISMTAKTRSVYNGENGVLPKTGGAFWYSDALAYCVSQGILTENEFPNLDQPATRAQLARLYAAALPDEMLQPVNAVSQVPDLTGETPYKDDILLLYRSGIVSGSDSQGSYRPDAYITRGEAASILSKVAAPAKRSSFTLLPFRAGVIQLSNDKAFSVSTPSQIPWLMAPGSEKSSSSSLYLQLFDKPLVQGSADKESRVIGEVIGYSTDTKNASAPLPVFHSLTVKNIAKELKAAASAPAVTFTLSDGTPACLSAFTTSGQENARYWVVTSEKYGRFTTLTGRCYLNQPFDSQNEVITVLKSLSLREIGQ